MDGDRDNDKSGNEKVRRALALPPGTPVRSAQTAAPVIVPVLRGKHERAPGDEIGESLDHWKRLLYLVLARQPFGLATEERRFGSVAVPRHFADAITDVLRGLGFETRSGDAYTDEARMLTFWRRLEPLEPAR